MLIVAGTFEIDPAERDAFIASREEAMRRSRAEPGCLEYVFAADPIEPGRVVLFERWESGEALAAHLEAMRAARPQPQSGGDRPPSVRPRSSEILRYEISEVRPLG